MNTGTIKFLNIEKGFGFILPDQPGADIFFHISGIGTDYEPQKGDQVIYSTKQGKKGTEACSIVPA